MKNMNNKKFAFKGFRNDLSCSNGKYVTQYVIGGTVVSEIGSSNPNQTPRLCSSDGYHYCNRLSDVFVHYPNNGKNRFCVVEILGNYSEDMPAHKGITTSLKVIKELTRNEIDNLVIEEKVNLDIIQKLQIQYPLCHVGGSIGLFLHGIRLNRMKKATLSDIDLIFPYYIAPEETKDLKLIYTSDKSSGNDFDYSFGVNDCLVDVKIDPKQRYEIIEYNGFKYKVSPLFTILEAKMRYALLGQSKHSNDIKEMILGHKEVNDGRIDLSNLFDL